MFSAILKHLTFLPSRPGKQLRRDERRARDHCVIEMNGKIFPVKDWSYGGVLLMADERMFALKQSLNFVMKFRLPHKIHTISHSGHVVRKSKDMIALQFEPLTRDLRHAFQDVVEAA